MNTYTTTRKSKIARLPRWLRNLLNEALADGRPADAILAWLNENDVTVAIMNTFFDGRGITEQNLSEWRKTGYVDWQRQQAELELARSFSENGQDVHEVTGGMLAERVAESAALMLAKLLSETMANQKGDKRLNAVLSIVRELSRLRHGNHRREQVEVSRERCENQKLKLDRKEKAKLDVETEVAADLVWAKFEEGVINKSLKMEEREELEAMTSGAPHIFDKRRKATAERLRHEGKDWNQLLDDDMEDLLKRRQRKRELEVLSKSSQIQANPVSENEVQNSRGPDGPNAQPEPQNRGIPERLPYIDYEP